MKHLTLILICLVSLSLIAEEVKLKIATVAPEGSLWVKKLREMNKEIKKKTKKRVSIKIYADAKKGTEKEVAKKISNHKLDGSLFLQSGIDHLVPQTSLLKLPYFYKNMAQWEKAQKINKSDLKKAFSKKNLKLLGWMNMGFTYMFSKQKVTSLNELRQTNSWMYSQESLMKKCFDGLELKGKEVQVKDVSVSLKKGEIANVYASPYLLMAMRWHENVEYCVNYPISNMVGGFVLTTQAYESIPQKYRKDVGKIIKKYMKVLNKTIQKENKIAQNKLIKKYKIQYLSPDQNWIQTTQDLGQKIAVQQVGEMYSQEQLSKTQSGIK